MVGENWTVRLTADSAHSLIGYGVEAIDGSIGKIDERTLDADSSYMVVDTGWWIFEKKRLIPAGLISSINGTEQKVYLTMTKHDVRAAPDYKPIEHSSESGRYNDYYGRYVS
ncbi:MAG: PRC-barrel domain-containing protein [Actinomycetota bacterium]|nr:PRC-barrel domain-containing protein [Actinomycetota bacterium]